MADYRWFGKTLKLMWLKKIEFASNPEELKSILSENKKLVIAVNHGPTLGPLAVWAAVSASFSHVGEDERIPLAVVWKKFYDMPIMKNFARFITQIDQAVPLKGYADLLKDGPFNDFWVAPEGDNCNFGNGFDIQPFVSDGFIEIAIRAEAPILLAVHQGTEDWSLNVPMNQKAQNIVKRLPLPQRYFQRLEETGNLSISNLLKGRLDNCKIAFKLYEPRLTLEDLSDDKATRKAQLAEEANVIREMMQALVEEMKPTYINYAKAA
jgi:hypothetical protein